MRTLVIASAASALAAIVTSQFWIDGTPIAAALTPVIVTLVSELLHRPTERIAQRFTTGGDALPRGAALAAPETDALPEAAGAGPPPRQEEHDPRPAREPPAQGLAGDEPEYRVYGTSPPRRIPWKPILVTATIAFIVGMAALTLPELIAGQALGSGDRKTTLFGGGSGDRQKEPPRKEQTEPEATNTVPDPAPAQPQQTAPETLQPPPDQTAPSAPPAPAPPPQSPVPQAPLP